MIGDDRDAAQGHPILLVLDLGRGQGVFLLLVQLPSQENNPGAVTREIRDRGAPFHRADRHLCVRILPLELIDNL